MHELGNYSVGAYGDVTGITEHLEVASEAYRRGGLGSTTANFSSRRLNTALFKQINDSVCVDDLS